MRRLRQGIVAATTALAMLLTGTAQPARAEDGAADNVIDLALLAWNVYKAGAVTPDQAVQFMRLLTGAISETQNAVIGHIDSLEAHDVMGHLRDVTVALADYEATRENEIWIAQYVRLKLAGQASNAYEKYYGVSNQTAKDQIGLAGQSLYSTLLTLATDAGLTSARARALIDYRNLMGDIVKDLEPKCTAVQVHGTTPAHYVHQCTAANGAKGTRVDDVQVLGPAELAALKAEAAKDSAWLAAKRTLEGLGQ